VDDEVGNLRTFELAFRRDFSIVTAESGSEALALIANEPIAVVLSDHRMPGMSGTDLLARVREMAPRAIRLLVTAYGDATTLAQAINDGCIYRYIPKPWDPGEMKAVVRQAIELYSLEHEKDVLISNLSTLNRVSRQISDKLEVDSLLASLERTIVSDLGFDGACALLRSNDVSRLSWHSSFPSVEDLEGREFGMSREGSKEVFESLEGRQSALIRLEQGLQAGPEIRAILSRLAAEEVFVLPLHGRRGLMGALLVDNRRGGGQFSSKDRQLLEGLAAQASTALDNAQLVGELRNDAARTSGADALAIAAALGGSLLREIQAPLFEVRKLDMPADVASALGRTIAALEAFRSVLVEQRPIRCDLKALVDVARSATSSLAVDHNVNVEVKLTSTAIVEALPGRVTQLLIHLLETAIERAVGGAVVVSLSIQQSDASVQISSLPGEEGNSGGGDPDRDLLRLTACEALAREVGAAVELPVDPLVGYCSLRLRVLPTT
jgi:CheY-like chemotaxis protein